MGRIGAIQDVLRPSPLLGRSADVFFVPASSFDRAGRAPYEPPKLETDGIVMKVRNSLKSLRGRHRDNKIVRRKGRVYVINKTQPRFKARQG